MEGDGGRLETEPHDEQRHPRHEGGCNQEVSGGDITRNFADIQYAGRAVDQRDAVQQKGGGKGPQQKVLERGLRRPGIADQEAAKDIDCDGHDLQADEDGDEMVGGNHDHHAQDAEQQQGVIFAFDHLFPFNVPERQQRHEKRNHQHQRLEKRPKLSIV